MFIAKIVFTFIAVIIALILAYWGLESDLQGDRRGMRRCYGLALAIVAFHLWWWLK